MGAAGIIHKCVRVREGKLPLSAYADNSSFKVYMVDTGLLCSKFGIPANAILHSPHSFDGFKGALAENYLMQALVTNGFSPYYWSSPGKAELDFVFQDREGNPPGGKVGGQRPGQEPGDLCFPLSPPLFHPGLRPEFRLREQHQKHPPLCGILSGAVNENIPSGRFSRGRRFFCKAY